MERVRLKKRIAGLLWASLGSSRSVSSRKLSGGVQEPIFVSRRQDFQKLDRSLSLPSFSDDHSSLPMAPPRISVDCTGCLPTKHHRQTKSSSSAPEIFIGDGKVPTCPPATPNLPSNSFFKQLKEEMERVENKKTTKPKTKKKLISNSYGFTSSSSGESDDGGFFSSDEGKTGRLEERELETETLFSSKSFSSDSSEFYSHPTRRKTRRSSSGRQKPRSVSGRRHDLRPSQSISPVSKKDGFAVVKRSSDPYGDFRTSMVEMIVEKQIFGAKDLERLLHSYLYLNSPHHHQIIIDVFSEIRETLFGN